MEQLREYLPQYVVSNTIAVLVLWLAWKKPTAARMCLGVIFLGASLFNAYTAATTPEDYLGYERFAVLESYRQFIRGWFAKHTGPMVLSIAAGQFVIAIGMFLNRKLKRMAIVGAVVFGLAIAPLGVGSASPCSILLAISAVLLWNRGHGHRYKEQPD